jgi:2-aminoethylphosphonate-pyruvate transaminase
LEAKLKSDIDNLGNKKREIKISHLENAIILAAGKGRRLYPLTKNQPKCLIEVGGKTLIERQVEQLANYGIKKIIAVVGFKEDKVRSTLSSLETRFDIHVAFVRNLQYESTNTAYSLLLAKEESAGAPFVQLDGDIICEDGAILKLITSNYENALLVDTKHGKGREEVKVIISKNFQVKRLSKNINPQEANGEFIGASKLSGKGAAMLFDAMERLSEIEKKTCYYDDVMDKCANQMDLRAIPISPYKWVEIDFLTDYLTALKVFSGTRKELKALTNTKHFPVLMSPGPVMISENTRNALLHPDICHREEEFSEVLTKIRFNLLRLYGVTNDLKYSCMVLTGSGSAANEAVLSSLAPKVKKTLTITNGEFGERLALIADRHMIKKIVLRYDWGKSIRPDDVEKILVENPDVDLVCMVHHETSTSMLNPIHSIGEITFRFGKLFFVDAVSSLGAEPVEVERNHISFCSSAPNKAIAAPPGLSFVCGERKELEKLRGLPARVSYLDLFKHYEYEEELLQTPNTPAVHLFFALDAALNEILSEDQEQRIIRYQKLASLLRTGMKKLGLSFYISEELMPNVLTTVNLPEGIDAQTFHDALREKGYIIYPGKGKLKDKVFQVANMGAVSEKDINGFLHSLKIVLRER